MLSNIKLQLFAGGEKTEKPTPKRRKEAREKGQVLQSRELTSALLLIFIFLALKIFGNYMFNSLKEHISYIYSEYLIADDFYSKKEIILLLRYIILKTAKIVAPILGIAFIFALIINYFQVGFLFTTKTLQIKFSRINPIEGFKRIFSKKALVELVKSFLKILLIGYIMYSYIMGQIKNIMRLLEKDISNIIFYIAKMSFEIAIRIGLALFILSVLDYAYQWWEYEKNLKMSKQEIKEEYKQTEGDPVIKSKIKEKQRQISMRRMMQDVPKADVIITNPTHYAVALKYDKEKYDAPYVIAKGKDMIAENIKKVAKESSIPVVENKWLARHLYNNVEIGQVIPEELYQAVAEILAYVYSLKKV
ncbi:flagellar biosynthesis protein FlhB [Caloranaerobacter azorensis]|uniref:Flagellar biosynthetic protein FlhB n=1 Tax=Caloranaerobacter azorensis TaxID=116090 RepID=A0A6P1YA07_9FIRM|nr:flagellar biosynthesis protein FlhB [Caloranaerobacter azorensis]QIB26179.1 flagellar biosynthesis protein FlhB [Caloranaerobacter azorensis]